MKFKLNKQFLIRGIIDILGLVLASYLLTDEFVNFSSKPTYSSITMEKLKPKNFPVITVCPVPGFDLEKLLKYGYKSIHQFQMGEIERETKGWSGNCSSLVEDVVQDIALYKSSEDCPVVNARFEGTPDLKQMKSNLTNLVYSIGRCCVTNAPEIANEHILQTIMIFVGTSGNSTPKDFQTYLSSKENFHLFKMDASNTNGIRIYTPKDRGFQRFSIKLQEKYQLEENPYAGCKNYKKRNEYAEV